MATLSSLRDARLLGEISMASADSVTYKNASIPGTALQSAANVNRSQLIQEDAAVYALELETWRVTGTGALLGTTAGTPSGAFGLTYGTHGSASPKIVGESASGNSKTNTCRRLYTLPPEYQEAETVTLRVHARITADANTSETIDAEVYETDGEAGVGSDICATAAQTLTTSFASYDFTITATTLTAGDTLDIELTGVADDTGGAAGAVIEIGEVFLLLDIRG